MSEVTIELEKRKCVACGNGFKVSTKSKQLICSRICERVNEPCRDQKKVSNKEKNIRESVTLNVTELMKNSVKKNSREGVLQEWPGQRKRRLANEESIMLSEIITETESEPGLMEIETESMNTEENIIEENETSSSDKPTKAVANVVQPTDSKLQFESLKEATSRSMSLIDESVMHLREVMKRTADVSKHEDEFPIAYLDRVGKVCQCADQIHKLLKIKVDAIKAINEIGGL